MTRRAGRRTAGVLTVAALLVFSFSLPASSWAHWSTTSGPLSASLGTGTVSVAPNFVCNSTPDLLAPYVTLTWNAAPSDPAADIVGYEVWVRNADSTARTQLSRADPLARTQVIRATLSDLLGGLTDALLGGKPVFAEVVTVHASGWTSSPTSAKAIVRTGLLPGVLGGLRCQ